MCCVSLFRGQMCVVTHSRAPLQVVRSRRLAWHVIASVCCRQQKQYYCCCLSKHLVWSTLLQV